MDAHASEDRGWKDMAHYMSTKRRRLHERHQERFAVDGTSTENSLFNGVSFFVTDRNSDEIIPLIIKHGGMVQTTMVSSVSVVVSEQLSSSNSRWKQWIQNYLLGKKLRYICVKPSWIHEAIKLDNSHLDIHKHIPSGFENLIRESHLVSTQHKPGKHLSEFTENESAPSDADNIVAFSTSVDNRENLRISSIDSPRVSPDQQNLHEKKISNPCNLVDLASNQSKFTLTFRIACLQDCDLRWLPVPENKYEDLRITRAFVRNHIISSSKSGVKQNTKFSVILKNIVAPGEERRILLCKPKLRQCLQNLLRYHLNTEITLWVTCLDSRDITQMPSHSRSVSVVSPIIHNKLTFCASEYPLQGNNQSLPLEMKKVENEEPNCSTNDMHILSLEDSSTSSNSLSDSSPGDITKTSSPWTLQYLPLVRFLDPRTTLTEIQELELSENLMICNPQHTRDFLKLMIDKRAFSLIDRFIEYLPADVQRVLDPLKSSFLDFGVLSPGHFYATFNSISDVRGV